jgi:hypothetical protein
VAAGPVVSQAQVWPEVISTPRDLQVTAFADDTDRGGSQVVRLDFRIDNGPWHVMDVVDGSAGNIGDSRCDQVEVVAQ